jgi:hypothetical protein
MMPFDALSSLVLHGIVMRSHDARFPRSPRWRMPWMDEVD